MPGAVFICGAECGIAATGTASAGTEHWSAATGTAATVSTTTYNDAGGVRAFRFNPSAATSLLTHTFASAVSIPATIVARFYVYFTTVPSASTFIFRDAASNYGVYFNQSDSTLRAAVGTGSGVAASGYIVGTGTWYRVDMKLEKAATTTCDIQVNGNAQAQGSLAAGAANSTGVTIGNDTAVTTDFYIDDIFVSVTSGDYPIGGGGVVGLYPNGDRTNSAATPTDGNWGHWYSAVGDFGKGSGGGTDLGAQNVESTSWQSLAKPLSTSVATNFIANKLGASTEHLVWTHDAMPAGASIVNGVMLVATTHSATATANNQTMGLQDASGNLASAWSFLDLSENTITVPVVIMANAPGGAWTPATVDGAFFLWGNSSDVNPDSYLDGVCLEVDTYIPVKAHPSATSPVVLPRSATVQARNSW